MNHYVYKIVNTGTTEYYIGVRSSKEEPNKDKYMGSMVTWCLEDGYNPSNFIKEVIEIFETREEANKFEIAKITECINDKLNKNFSIPPLHFNTLNKVIKIRRILQYDGNTGEYINSFKSATEANKHTNCNVSEIRNACKNNHLRLNKGTRRSGGYIFCYEESNLNSNDILDIISKIKNGGIEKKVYTYDIKTGKLIKEYNSFKSLSYDIGLPLHKCHTIVKNVDKAIENGFINASKPDMVISTRNDLSKIFIKNCFNDNGSRIKKKIYSYSLDGSLVYIYDSLMDVQRKLGIHNATLSRILSNSKNITKEINNLYFSYILYKSEERILKIIKNDNK